MDLSVLLGVRLAKPYCGTSMKVSTFTGYTAGTSSKPRASVPVAPASVLPRAQHRRSGSWRAKSLQVNWSNKLSGPAARQSHPRGPLWPGLLVARLFAGCMTTRCHGLRHPLETRQGFKNENAGFGKIKKGVSWAVLPLKALGEGPSLPHLGLAAGNPQRPWWSSAGGCFIPTCSPAFKGHLPHGRVCTLSPLCVSSLLSSSYRTPVLLD